MAATMRRLQTCRRSMPMFQVRCSSIVSTENLPVNTEDSNSLYPPIKPKYPPGRWGGMDRRYAWLWDKHREESLAIPDVRQRINALCEKEMNQLQYKVKEYRPRVLGFKTYVTKTKVIHGLPDVYHTSLDASLLDEWTSRLSPLVCDLIVMDTDEKLRRNFLKDFTTAGGRHQEQLRHVLLRSILTALTTQLSAQFPHLLTMQYDEQVNLSAMWDRHGLERRRQCKQRNDSLKFETVNDHRMTSTTKADFILRSDKPLPEFVSREESPSIGEEFPELEYSPRVYGQHREINRKRKVEAGHVWGDPSEFGLLSVLNTMWSRYPAEKYGAHHAQDAVLGQGIGTSFVWLVAQAYNQGFNTFIEMTYPLTTQTVLTDGQHWRFLAYQLNTLELWKDDEANNLVNLCWVSDEAKLYDSVEGGKVQGFNPDVLRQLITFLALAPADRPYNLRPTLPASAENPRDKEEFVPVRKEEEVVIEEEKYVV